MYRRVCEPDRCVTAAVNSQTSVTAFVAVVIILYGNHWATSSLGGRLLYNIILKRIIIFYSFSSSNNRTPRAGRKQHSACVTHVRREHVGIETPYYWRTPFPHTWKITNKRRLVDSVHPPLAVCAISACGAISESSGFVFVDRLLVLLLNYSAGNFSTYDKPKKSLRTRVAQHRSVVLRNSSIKVFIGSKRT